MFNYYFNRIFQTYNSILVKYILSILTLSPNIITIFTVIFAFIALSLCYFNYVFIGFIFFIISGFLDVIDGQVARERKITSDFGAALDIYCDRICESLFLLAIYITHDFTYIALCSLIASYLCVTSFLIVSTLSLKNEHKKSFFYSPGLIERFEAYVFFSVMLLTNYHIIFGITYSVLTVYTSVFRLYEYKKQTL
jgi:phosphatidylglycerophosphate synthase